MKEEMKGQNGTTNHHVGLHHRPSSKVPRTAGDRFYLSLCITIVGRSLPGDISNPYT